MKMSFLNQMSFNFRKLSFRKQKVYFYIFLYLFLGLKYFEQSFIVTE